MVFGSKPTDGGHLNFTAAERDDVLAEDPRAEEFIRRYCGRGRAARRKRALLPLDRRTRMRSARSTIAPIARARRDGFETHASARVRRRAQAHGRPPIPLPSARAPRRVSRSSCRCTPRSGGRSSRWAFWTLGLSSPTRLQRVYGAEPWLFALLQSRMHTAWVGTVGGKIKTDYRYCAGPLLQHVPGSAARRRRQGATHRATRSRSSRRASTTPTSRSAICTCPSKMPADLERAHEALDATVDSLYRAASLADR